LGDHIVLLHEYGKKDLVGSTFFHTVVAIALC
jgi:hypothetical protein